MQNRQAARLAAVVTAVVELIVIELRRLLRFMESGVLPRNLDLLLRVVDGHPRLLKLLLAVLVQLI